MSVPEEKQKSNKDISFKALHPISENKGSPYFKKYNLSTRTRNLMEVLPQVIVKKNLILKSHAHPTPIKRNILPSTQKSKHGSPLGKLTENPSITAPSSIKSTNNPSSTQCNKASTIKLKNSCTLCKGKSLSGIIHEQLYNKYEVSTQNTYNLNMVNDIILNTNTLLVVNFKEYLICDDSTEFLKVFYTKPQTQDTLKELINYHDTSSKVFPNFVTLEEKKYMFKNICRKQKVINRRYMQLAQPKMELGKRLFTTKFLSEITVRCSRVVGNEKVELEELLDKFVCKDSLSTLHKTKCEDIKESFSVKKKPAVEVKSPQKKLVVMAKNFLGAVKNKKPYRRHASQKELTKSIKTNGCKKSGRASATGSYYSRKKEDKKVMKNAIGSARVTLSDTDPFHINIKLNLILDKERLRCETPYICAMVEDKNRVLGLCQVEAVAKKAIKKELLNNKIGKAVKQCRNKQGFVLTIDQNGNLLGKTKRKKRGRGSVNSQQKKNVAINHLCKSIKNLLSPTGLGSSKGKNKSRKVNSPREARTTRCMHRRSGTDIVQDDIKHISALELKKYLLPI